MMVPCEVHLSAPGTWQWILHTGQGDTGFDLLSKHEAVPCSTGSFPGTVGTTAVSGAFGSWCDGPEWVTFLDSPL